MSLAHMSDPDYSKILVLNPAITNSTWVKKKKKERKKGKPKQVASIVIIF